MGNLSMRGGPAKTLRSQSMRAGHFSKHVST